MTVSGRQAYYCTMLRAYMVIHERYGSLDVWMKLRHLPEGISYYSTSRTRKGDTDEHRLSIEMINRIHGTIPVCLMSKKNRV